MTWLVLKGLKNKDVPSSFKIIIDSHNFTMGISKANDHIQNMILMSNLQDPPNLQAEHKGNSCSLDLQNLYSRLQSVFLVNQRPVTFSYKIE